VGNIFITLGIGLVLVGIAYKFGLLGWFGNLPGDISYNKGNFSVYAPIGSMIVISVVISLLMRFFR
jgi:hypothetical protein